MRRKGSPGEKELSGEETQNRRQLADNAGYGYRGARSIFVAGPPSPLPIRRSPSSNPLAKSPNSPTLRTSRSPRSAHISADSTGESGVASHKVSANHNRCHYFFFKPLPLGCGVAAADRILLQPVLSWTSSFVVPMDLMSRLTQSIHLCFGLPRFLLPGVTISRVVLLT